MADLTHTFDGQLTLEETTRACEAVQYKGYQLQTITHGAQLTGGQPLLVNRADFTSTTTWKPNLLFVEVGTQDPNSLKQQKQAEGWTFVCHSHMYVAGVLTSVMVFEK